MNIAKPLPLIVATLVLIALAKRALSLTPYMAGASFSYLMMICGVLYRMKRIPHATFMAMAIGIDLTLVLVLELQRHAVETALKFSLTPLQQAHIGASTVATILYFPLVALGVRGLKRKLGARGRSWHMGIGIAAFVFRTLGFFLMFSLLSHVKK